MANTTVHAAQSLPRFLLPRLSWQGPAATSRGFKSGIILSQQVQAASLQPDHGSGSKTSWRALHSETRSQPQRPSAILRNPALRRSFHSTAPRMRDHHFDTLKFVQRLQSEGFTEDQSAAMMKVLNDVIEERFMRQKATYTQKVDFAKLRSELLSADSTESSTTRVEHERLTNDITKLNSRLRDEIGRTQASVRLDLNLEKGRIREEAANQELKIKETETKIEQEVATLREKLEQVKFQTLQWLMGVCTGFAALLLGAWRLLM
ncbi:hypothetical protein PG997_003543 [Apiospora hydei]|uniref:DUF1640 domain-containing protein n=1 Tax=Apiospora hydei TaxID=1337664 RepID=A0ABR1WZI0_9PEZI